MDEQYDFVIDFTEEDQEPINITAPSDDPIEADFMAGDVFYISEHRKYDHTLSQIDIDNKYITINELSEITNKESVLVFVAQCGVKLQIGQDYIINQYNRIVWSGLLAENQLQVGDMLEIFY